MHRIRRRQFRYGFLPGVMAFFLGWAAVTVLVPERMIAEAPAVISFWLWLDANGVSAGSVSARFFLEGATLTEFSPSIDRWHAQLLAIGLVTASSLYSVRNVSSSGRINHTIENTLPAGVGYLAAALGAMIYSGIRPFITAFVLGGLILLAAVWLGSTVVNKVTGGLPIFGIVTLGTVATIGLVIIVGGAVSLIALRVLLLLSLAPPLVVGILTGLSRQSRTGSRGDQPIISDLVAEYWVELLVFVLLAALLAMGLGGVGGPDDTEQISFSVARGSLF